MALHSQQSLSGFIPSEPQQSVAEKGDTRFHIRRGQPHLRRESDGSFAELEPTYSSRDSARFATVEVAAPRSRSDGSHQSLKHAPRALPEHPSGQLP